MTIKKVKEVLGLIMVVISVMGIVTFSMFILEESFQTIMFGTWPAQDAKRWDIVLKGTDLMEKALKTLRFVNYTCGWVQPLAFVSYRSYAISEEFYIESLRAKILANDPYVMVGRDIEFRGTPRTWKKLNERLYIASYGRIRVISPIEPAIRPTTISGRLRLSGNMLYIYLDNE